MDIEKLIEQLEKASADGRWNTLADYAHKAATALSALQAENTQLRAYLEYEREHADAYYEECGQWEAENEKLRETVDKYATAARAIALHLKLFCDESLPYDEMIADAARKASAELEQVNLVRCKDCKMSRPGGLGYVWCGPTAMPLDGFCSNGQQKED